MVLCDREIIHLLNCKIFSVKPIDMRNIGPSSVDLHLSSKLKKYTCSSIALGKTTPTLIEIDIDTEKGYEIKPGEFLLGCTVEEVSLPPNLQGWIETKGDIARAGLQIHNCDGHIDPGFSGSITLEVTNNNNIPLILYPNVPICQLYLLRLSSECKNPYIGKYNNQKKPTAYIPTPKG